MLLLLLAFVVPLPDRLGSAGSTVVEFRDGTPAHVFLSPDEKWRVPLSLTEVAPAYLEALLRLEDKRFWAHPGVDPLAIGRALVLNLQQGRVVSGGSTITMQLVRVLEPRPRTVFSKAIEAARALQLELRLSKEEILEAYLAFIPFGRNVEGIEAASLSYFGHTARSLTADEIAVLLAVPQEPTHRFPTPANRERLRAARNEIAKRLAEHGVLPVAQGSTTAETLAQVERAPVPTELKPFPRKAPHAAVYLADRVGGARIRSTLDAGVERMAERLLGATEGENRGKGIHNAAIVVVDHRTSEVRALVGSFDFWDATHGGQIVGFAEPRSPGSALKPFLYAQAIDLGLVLPETLIPDVPTQFGGYVPKNFEGGFSGLVRLEDALSRSLNVPFVKVLEQVGVEQFLGLLNGMGATSLRTEPGWYGLSAIIGGVELTPLEVAGFYVTLAEGGRYRPLTFTRGAPAVEPVVVLSPGAAFLTRRALGIRNRPDLPDSRRATGMAIPIHWKTGTSFGHRDAWAVGSSAHYTAAVWLGNFDQSPSHALVGAQVAGPILFDLLEALEPRTGPPEPDYATPDLKALEVCAYSGLPPNAACPERHKVLALTSHVPTRECPFHVQVDVDVDTGLALTPGCRTGKRFHSEVFLSWPLAIRRWLKDHQGDTQALPALAPGCAAQGPRTPPHIVSPPPGQELVLISGMATTEQEIPLEAECDTPQVTLSWFMDGRFLGSVSADERLWWRPAPGVHELVVLDEAGLSATRSFSVVAGP